MSIFQPFSSHPSFSDVFSLFFPRGCSSLCWSSVCPQGPRAELGGFSLKISFSLCHYPQGLGFHREKQAHIQIKNEENLL